MTVGCIGDEFQLDEIAGNQPRGSASALRRSIWLIRPPGPAWALAEVWNLLIFFFLPEVARMGDPSSDFMVEWMCTGQSSEPQTKRGRRRLPAPSALMDPMRR